MLLSTLASLVPLPRRLLGGLAPPAATTAAAVAAHAAAVAAPIDQRQRQEQLVDYLLRLAAADAAGVPAEAALGFRLAAAPSTLPGAGAGVFLAAGSCPAGSILSLYPGLVHDAAAVEAELAASAPDDAQAPVPPPWTASNVYLLSLRCGATARTLLTDGQPHGLSAQRFAAAAAGGGGGGVNSAWLPRARVAPPALLQQAALGHLFNHRAGDATFDIAALPAGLPQALLRFVPSLHARGFDPARRWVPLVVARHALQAPPGGGTAELFADYGVDYRSLGYHP